MKFILIALIAVLVISSCSAPKYVYSPTSINAPFFTEKNQSKVGISYVSHGSESFTRDSFVRRGNAAGYDIQAGYAIAKNWLIHGSYAHRIEDLSSDNRLPGRYAAIDYDRFYADGGIGYYTSMGTDSIVYFQALAGYGYGKSEFTDFDNNTRAPIDRFHKSTVNKYFLQGSFQLLFKNIKLQFPNRFTVAHFGKVETNYTQQELSNNYLTGLDGYSILLYEPAINLAFNLNSLPALSLDTQVGTSFKLKGDNQYYRRRTTFASIGIFADLGKLFNSTKK